MTLHIVNKSPYLNNSLERCLDNIDAGAALLLIEDGVLAATNNKSPIDSNQKDCQFYVLKEDLIARGLLENCQSNFTIIDYDGFVSLTEQFKKSISW